MAKAKKYSKKSGRAGSKVPSTSKSRGRSEELKDVVFTFGKSTDAAAFEQTNAGPPRGSPELARSKCGEYSSGAREGVQSEAASKANYSSQDLTL